MTTKYAQSDANWGDLAAAATWFDASSGGTAVDGPQVVDAVALNGHTVAIRVTDGPIDLANYTLFSAGTLNVNTGASVVVSPGWTVHNSGTVSSNTGIVWNTASGTVTSNNSGGVVYAATESTISANVGTIYLIDTGTGPIITSNTGVVRVDPTAIQAADAAVLEARKAELMATGIPIAFGASSVNGTLPVAYVMASKGGNIAVTDVLNSGTGAAAGGTRDLAAAQAAAAAGQHTTDTGYVIAAKAHVEKDYAVPGFTITGADRGTLEVGSNEAPQGGSGLGMGI